MCLQKVEDLRISNDGPELLFKEDISDTFERFLVQPKFIKLINSNILDKCTVL